MFRVIVAVVACLCASGVFGQAFSYQGRLTDGGGAVDGVIDVRARVFDAGTGGGMVGSTWQRFGVEVESGLFSVEIDFGGGVFSGFGERWLQIEVRPAGVGAFVVLGPRQRVLSVPRAGYAEQAAYAEEAGFAAFALDGPFEPVGSVPRSSSGLAAGSELEVELVGTVNGSLIMPIPSVLLSPVGEGYGEVVWGAFELGRAWTPTGNLFQTLLLDDSIVPPDRELVLRVRCAAANALGGSSGEVVWEIPCRVDRGDPGYRLEIGPNGGLFEVVRLEFDSVGSRAGEFRRLGGIGPSGNEASVVPVVARPDANGVLGGVSAFGATFGFGNDVPELSVVGTREDENRVSSVVQSIAAGEPLFQRFFSPSCVQASSTGAACLIRPSLYALDQGVPILVEESRSFEVRALGWALVIADDGLPYEEYYFDFEFFGTP